MILLAFKVLFLFIAVMFTIVNITKACLKNNIPSANVVLQTVGIVGFVTLVFMI